MNRNDGSENIRQRLLHAMKDGLFSRCEKLPRETVLSEQMGISRTQLRDALSELEREGFITRRHGVGTLINRHVLQVKNRMDIEKEFLEIIRQHGYHADVVNVQLYEEPADEFIAEKLKVPVGTAMLRISRVCTADGKPAIYCDDVVEKRFVKSDYTLEDLKPPIFYFMKKTCDVDAYLDLTQLHAAMADEKIAKALDIPIGTLLLNMEEVDYDIDGNVVFYSNQYFVEGFFEQTVLRKKI